MKIQIEQIDLLQPWPRLALKDGYRAVRILVRLGEIPIGQLMMRPVRKREISHRRLRRRIAKVHSGALLKAIAKQGLLAGPEALESFLPGAWPAHVMGRTDWSKTQKYVEERILLPSGIPSPTREWFEDTEHAQRSWPAPSVTVALCTRDREEILEECIRNLRQLDYPDFDILVVDNSSDPVPTREIAQRLGVGYVRCHVAGLSRARNIALGNARAEWVAFTDDDCRPEKNWLWELVRPIQNDPDCRCVCGLVLPAQLENAAEITFEIYGGLSRGYSPRVYDRDFLFASRTRPGPTWRIGAGANMLLHREFVHRHLGYDVDMGPGPHSVGGCGEDTDVFYRILAAGFRIHYTPRAIVHHFHRSSAKALRKQIYSYAVGHAAYHTRCLLKYRDHRSLMQLVWQLPRYFMKNLRSGLSGRGKYPFPLVFVEMRGTLRGPIEYGWTKLRRFVRERVLPQTRATFHVQSIAHQEPPAPPVAPPSKPRLMYDPHAGEKSQRAA